MAERGVHRPRATDGGHRVLMIVGPAAGGIGAHAASLVQGLTDEGWQVVVATAPVTAARFDLGPHVEVSWPGRRPVAVWRALRRLRALAAGADVVHAQGHQAGLVALLVTAGLGRRAPSVVISWHNAILGAGILRRARTLLERVQVRRADLVTGASQDLVDRATSLGARRAELAEVAAPAAGRAALDRAAARALLADELGIDPDGDWLLTVSRIAPQKNLDVLVDAARIAQGRRGGASERGVVWLVVGDGRDDLLASLRASVAADATPVRFVGARSDVPTWMAAADLFVLPSAWEARALVVQEALAAGLPIVASAVGGLPELVANAGVLVPVGDPHELAEAVVGLLADPERRAVLAAAGRRRWAALPDAADVLEEWTARYRSMM
ncbi:glycosyltransferase family 1 protein (plasmid) [Cellulomonas sp. WB94]|uniref:glycosyltransferase family 4 protein n=1 Tax=Cellulomonas sp. WB94 TaxID=2173174 RepID=UPI000D572701|nr:glycosyltransferase family 4 protein [Cellulomonas sp. WB94]PVU81229.1 glycosyltransferase family 1 protein [Cellulomonas sp. WB94]